jgi:predicted aconitase
MSLALTAGDRATLDGAHGPAAAMAMRIVVRTAEAMDASGLLDIEGAHVDGCLYHGLAGLDFAERLASLGGTVRVPTSLNVSSLDLLHPELVRLPPDRASDARRLMDAYVALGCRPTWTCAPYQLEDRPGLGAQLAWAESNAIVFANSVLGARTERYGDFIDVCCAITGRAPAIGLHTDAGRRASLAIVVDGVPERLARSTAGLAALGQRVGVLAGRAVPAIDGLPHGLGEDALKALGAAAASSGSVALVHVVGSTPEAPTLGAVLIEGSATVTLGTDDLRRARDGLTTARDPTIGAVCLGTPHASVAELRSLLALLRDAGRPNVPCYVNTSRTMLEALGDREDELTSMGVTVVTDTCTYVTPILGDIDGAVMTDSAKWAWYAPTNLGFDVVFGTTEECLRSAAGGRVWRDDALWGGP